METRAITAAQDGLQMPPRGHKTLAIPIVLSNCLPKWYTHRPQVDQKHIFSLGGRGTDTQLIVNSEHNQLGETDMTPDDRAAHICPVGVILFKTGNYAQPTGQRLYDQQPISAIGNHRAEDVELPPTL